MDIPRHDPTVGRLWDYVLQIFYAPVLPLVKVSAATYLFLYYATVRKGVGASAAGVGLFSALQLVAVTLATIFQCRPSPSAAFEGSRGGSTCVDRRVLYTGNIAIGLAASLFLFGLGVHVFRALDLPKRARWASMSIFVFGAM